MQIKTTMRYHLKPARNATTKMTRDTMCWWGCGKREPLHTVGGNVKWYSQDRNLSTNYTLWFLKKLKMELPCDPTIPLLGMYLKEVKAVPAHWCSHSIIHNPQAKETTEHVSWGKWIQKWWEIHYGIFLSHEKGRNPVIWDSMDGPWGYYAKWNKSERERQILYDTTYL